MFSSKEMGSSLTSLKMIFEAPQSDFFRFKFSTQSSGIHFFYFDALKTDSVSLEKIISCKNFESGK